MLQGDFVPSGMSTITLQSDPAVQDVFDKYPDEIRPKMMKLRRLILDAAESEERVTILEETLKWGEPSYLTKYGSTIRMDWKEKAPDQVAMYFKCTSKLVPTFREVFGEIFRFEGNRAIVFGLEEEIPETELKACIRVGLMYHKVKEKEWLGIILKED